MATHKASAIQNFKKFHGRPPSRISSFHFTMPKSVTFLGTLYAIEYLSNKGFRKKFVTRRYRHDTGPGVAIYLHPNGRTLIITGGHFRVTDWMRG